MFSKIIFTFASRIAIALLNLLIVVITAKFLGSQGRGTISLILLAITFSQVIHQFIGGNPLVYFTRKTAMRNLLIPSYLWGLVACVSVTYILTVTSQLPGQYALHVLGLSLIQSLLSTHLTLLLSYEKIKEQNFISFLQVLITAGWLLPQFYIFKKSTVDQYITALYISYSACYLVSCAALVIVKPEVTNEYKLSMTLLRAILNYGLMIQSTNIIQMLNYRISYFLINAYSGLAALGIFSTALSIGESVWLFSKSLTNVLYPKIVHSTDDLFRIDLTVKYAKFGLLITGILMIMLLLLPVSFYQVVFGKDFSEMKTLLLLLSPGLIIMGYSTLYAHYFSGISQNKINLYASGIGLTAILITGYYLIPLMRDQGACLATDLSYISGSFFLIIVFIKSTGMKLGNLLPSKIDFRNIQGFLK